MGHRGRPDYSLHPSRAPRRSWSPPKTRAHGEGMTPRHSSRKKRGGRLTDIMPEVGVVCKPASKTGAMELSRGDETHMTDRERHDAVGTDDGKTSWKAGLRLDRRRVTRPQPILEGSSRAGLLGCAVPLQPSGISHTLVVSKLRTCGTDVWMDSIPCHWGWPVACANRTKTAGSWRGRMGSHSPAGR